MFMIVVPFEFILLMLVLLPVLDSVFEFSTLVLIRSV